LLDSVSKKLACFLCDRHQLWHAFEDVTHCIDVVDVGAFGLFLAADYFVRFFVKFNACFVNVHACRVAVSADCNQNCVDRKFLDFVASLNFDFFPAFFSNFNTKNSRVCVCADTFLFKLLDNSLGHVSIHRSQERRAIKEMDSLAEPSE